MSHLAAEFAGLSSHTGPAGVGGRGGGRRKRLKNVSLLSRNRRVTDRLGTRG